MHTNLITSVLRTIHAHGMLTAGDRVGVAVSAGADSVALLRLLDELSAEIGIRLAVLHFNHRLRGAESDADEAFVAALAGRLGVEFLASRADVAVEARSHGWNLEDAARRLRYAFFASQVKAGRVTRVAVAHTADDQAETVLARLVRGTGPSGLASIYPVRGHVGRPLLDVRRKDLRAYLAGLGQTWREDSSNLELTRLRARMRHQILPMIENELQPAIVPHLARLATFAREDELFWNALVAERMLALTRREKGLLGIRCADLLAPADFLTRTGAARESQRPLSQRLVRALLAGLPGEPRQITARHVDDVLHLAEECRSGHRIELPRAIAERSFDWIWFEDRPFAITGTTTPSAESKEVGADQGFSRTIHLVPRPGENTTVAIPEIHRRIRLKVIDWSKMERETLSGDGTTGASSNCSPLEIIDAELLRSPLLLRSWRPGDAFRPRGRRHPLKLKEFLREGRIPVRDRQGWPVLTSAGALVWTRGLPVAAEFSPCQATRTGLLISEEPI